MGIGTSIFLIAVGAILKFAVTAEVSGLELSTVGVILMVCGALGLVLSLVHVQRRAPDDRGRPAGRARPRALLGDTPGAPGARAWARASASRRGR